jgi:hypothetical protein
MFTCNFSELKCIVYLQSFLLHYVPRAQKKKTNALQAGPPRLTQLALCLRLASILRPKADNAPSTLNDSTLLRSRHHRQVKHAVKT